MKKKIDFLLLCRKRKVMLVFYVSRILVRSQSTYLYLIYMFTKFCKIYHQKRQYSLKTINETFMEQLRNEWNSLEFDENYTAVINNKLFKGKVNAMLTVKYADECIHVNVKPFFSENIDNENIFISKALMFNISNKVVSPLTKLSLTASIKVLPAGKIGFADEIHLALVSNPYDLENNIIDALIRSYLQTPKLVRESDIISISLNLLEKQINLMKIHNIKQKLYFKCTKVFSKNDGNSNMGGHYVVFKETTVKQVANLQSFIPPWVELVECHNNNGEKDDEVLSPSGLKDYAEEIEEAVKPFLNRTLGMNPAFLIIGKKGSGKNIIVSNIASKFGIHLYRVTNFDVSANVYAQNETKLKNIFVNAKLYAPCILYLTNFENFEKNNEGQADERRISQFISSMKNVFENTRYPLILICSSNDDRISTQLKREFLEIFTIKPLNEEERRNNLKWLLQYHELCYSDNLEKLVQKSNNFFFEDFEKLIRLAKSHTVSASSDNNAVYGENLLLAIDSMNLHYHENIGAPKVPSVHWDDIGGMKDVKEEMIKTLNFLLKHSKFSSTTVLKRFGILLFGPPGTGKTMLAKAVATECNLCFLSVKGPELLNKYIGQSEENIREVFQRARAASPCIIFFDELDSLAPNRGMAGDSGGVMDRVVSQLLAELDGINEEATVFIIGATNRPDLIDPALLRPGRFDKLLYVGPAMDSATRLSVLKALTKEFNISEEVKLENVVELCPINISGADFYGICAEAWIHAVRRTILENKEGLIDNENFTEMDVVVEIDDFNNALASVMPSITSEDLLYYENLRKEISSNK